MAELPAQANVFSLLLRVLGQRTTSQGFASDIPESDLRFWAANPARSPWATSDRMVGTLGARCDFVKRSLTALAMSLTAFALSVAPALAQVSSADAETPSIELIKRPDAIGRAYLTPSNPIVDPRLDAGGLTFVNVAVGVFIEVDITAAASAALPRASGDGR